MNKIIVCVFLFILSFFAQADTCALSKKEGFHSIKNTLCIYNENYIEGMARENKFDINSFDLSSNKQVFFSASSKMGSGIFAAYEQGFFKVIGELPDGDVKKNLTGFSDVQYDGFSGDLYFITSAWATSGAVHMLPSSEWRPAIDKQLSPSPDHVKFLSPGNYLHLIKTGLKTGYLIINKHKYKKEGGSYDVYVLSDKNGKEIKEIGISRDDVKSFLYTEKSTDEFLGD